MARLHNQDVSDGSLLTEGNTPVLSCNLASKSFEPKVHHLNNNVTCVWLVRTAQSLWQWARVRNPAVTWIFLFASSSRPVVGTTQPTSYPVGNGIDYRGVPNNSSPAGAEMHVEVDVYSTSSCRGAYVSIIIQGLAVPYEIYSHCMYSF
jgi:hypothetical protein